MGKGDQPFLKLVDRYGGDCSGAESFLFGLQSVRDYFKRGGEILCRLLHAFSSEAPGAEGDPARAFQTLNCRPSTSYIDVCARTDTGLDFYSNEQVPIEEVDYYGAGFICKDISRMNTRHPKSLDIVMTSSSGMSTRTLHASKTYILKMQPKKFMIENVYRRSVIGAFLDLFGPASLPMYAIKIIIVDAQYFNISTVRKRVICIGINLLKCTIVRPLSEWGGVLRRMASRMRAVHRSFEMSMLSEDDERIAAVKEEMAKKYGEGTTTSRDWPATRRKHWEARDHLFHWEYNTIGPPLTIEEVGSHIGGGWYYRAREADMTYLHKFMAECSYGVTVFKLPLIWNVTQNVHFPRWKEKDMCGLHPVILRESTYHHVSKNRPVIGEEMLQAMGFPKSLRFTSEDRRIAFGALTP